MKAIKKKWFTPGMVVPGMAAPGMALSAHAMVVDYTTTATFSCAGCVITGNNRGDVKVVYGTGINTATLEFVGAPSGTSVESDASFVTAGYGYIQASSTGNGSAINGAFMLSIDQSGPNLPPLTGSFLAAALSGLVAGNRSTSYASFGSSPDPEITLGGPVTYELDTSKKSEHIEIRIYDRFSPDGQPRRPDFVTGKYLGRARANALHTYRRRFRRPRVRGNLPAPQDCLSRQAAAPGFPPTPRASGLTPNRTPAAQAAGLSL